MYVLQLDHNSPDAWRYCVTWPGYWAGLGYVEKPEDAVPFPTEKAASMAALGTHFGLSGLLKVVPLDPMEREYGPLVQ
jgi:hypothetical protein